MICLLFLQMDLSLPFVETDIWYWWYITPLLVFSIGSPWHELLSLCYSHIMADELYLVPPHPTSPSLPPWTPSVSMCRSTWQPQLWTPIPKPHPWTLLPLHPHLIRCFENAMPKGGLSPPLTSGHSHPPILCHHYTVYGVPTKQHQTTPLPPAMIQPWIRKML